MMRTFREKRTRDLRAPDVIGELFMLLMVVVIGVGAGTGSALVVALGTTAFVISAGGTLWSKLSLAEVAYDAEPSDTHAFEGDEIEIVMTLENRKPLPIPWVQIIEFLPTGMTPLSDENVKRRAYAGGSEIVETTSLAGYERIRFRHHVRAHHRGHYSIGPTELRSGDLFGLFGTVRRDSRSEHGITVYPRIVPLESWELPAAKPMGDILARNMLLDDPSRPRSVRDYRPGDPLKRIDWKLSAKRDELTVRTYDQSVSNDVVVMLESRTVDYAWHGYKYDVLEAAVTGAASIAVRCADLGYRVAMVANGVRPTRGVMSVVPAGDGPHHIRTILEALAFVQPLSFTALDALAMDRGAQAISSGSSIILVAGFLTEPVVAYLHHELREGHRVSIAWVGREEPPQVTGIPVVDARETFKIDEDSEDLMMSIVDEQIEMNARMNLPTREYDHV
ncbi:MAG: DUF58 domain-containing protein [Chloroflexi bacterium]|nr:DUF58 domain-containing protein [Chloroflexota bacterium]